MRTFLRFIHRSPLIIISLVMGLTLLAAAQPKQPAFDPEDIDIIRDADQRDQSAESDIATMNKNLKKQKNELSEAEKVDAELEQIRIANEKRRATEEAAAKKAEAERIRNERSELRKRYTEEQRLRQEIIHEDDIPEVTSEDSSWNGYQ